MSKNECSEDEKPIKHTSKFVDFKTRTLYEQLNYQSFIYINNVTQKYEKTDNIVFDRFVIMPIDNKVTENRYIPLPSDVEDYTNITTLIKEIDTHIYKYLDVSDRFRKLCSWYIPMSWITDQLNTINYLRALGDYGLAKTRFIDVVGRLCYKPIPNGGAANPAPIFRLMDAWKGTLLLDECTLYKSDKTSDIIQILNAGVQRGKPIWRCKSDNIDDVVPFDPFGPKLIGSRDRFDDKALESRCLTEMMKETERNDIPIELPTEFYEEQRHLRNKLLKFRFDNWRRKLNTNNIRIPNITKRLNQMISPFLIVYNDFDNITQEIKTFAKHFNKTLIKTNSETIEGGIVRSILDLYLIDRIKYISSSDIKIKLQEIGYSTEKLNEVSIGIKRSNLNIESDHINYSENGKPKQKNSIVWNLNMMKSLVRKYIPFTEKGGGGQEYYMRLIDATDNIDTMEESDDFI